MKPLNLVIRELRCLYFAAPTKSSEMIGALQDSSPIDVDEGHDSPTSDPNFDEFKLQKRKTTMTRPWVPPTSLSQAP